MLSRAAWRLRFPEFDSASDTLVDGFLAQAWRRIDEEVWGEKADDGHGLLTAHLLALSPHGQMARLTQKDVAKTTSTYGLEFGKLEEQVACGIRVF